MLYVVYVLSISMLYVVYIHIQCIGLGIQITFKQCMSIREFLPLTKLGEGTYSSVYKVRRVSDEKIYALKKVKLFQLSTKQKQNALTEIRILASIDSPTIIAYKQAFFDQQLNVLCIVMEYADGGDLLQIIGQYKKDRLPIQEHVIWLAATHILKGLCTLHSRGVLHRDLKCANVFKSNGTFKLGDLNVSKINKGKLARTQTGTPYYASPQVWRDEEYDSKSDIWSLGCIIFEMAAFQPPFAGRDLQQLYKAVQGKPVPKISNMYSKELKNLIMLCLQKQAQFRPTAQELLEHSVFKPIFDSYQQPINDYQANNHNLLCTIKLPTDLKELKQNLPSSKYEDQKEKRQYKKYNLQERGSISQQAVNSPYDLNNAEKINNKHQNIQKVEKVQNIHKNEKPTTNQNVGSGKIRANEVYLSPRSAAILRMRSPDTQKKEVKMQPQKYSERLYVSDKKQRPTDRPSDRSSNKSYAYVNKSEVNLKRKNPGVAKYDYCLNQIQQLKRNLQKRRICSSNGPKRNYWG